jgi:hypothetical protein
MATCWLVACVLCIFLALAAPARADVVAGLVDARCHSALTFPDAREIAHGNTTRDNRQLSVYMVLCAGFGSSAAFAPGGGVFCTLLADAIGARFARYALFADGACAARNIALRARPTATACGMLASLLTRIPAVVGYGLAAGVACDLSQPLGTWIESLSEKHAAEAVWHKHECLEFVTHHFPLGDQWSATPCALNDRGFGDLQLAARDCGPYPGGSWYPGTPAPEVTILKGSVSCTVAAQVLVAAENRGIHLEQVGSWWCFGPPLGAHLPKWSERCGLPLPGQVVLSYRDFYGTAPKFREMIQVL